MPAVAEADGDREAYDGEGDRDNHTKIAGGALRANRRGESPLAKEIPYADAQMHRRRRHTDHVKPKIQRMRQLKLYTGESGIAARQKSFGVNVPENKDERDQSGIALKRVHPIADPWIFRYVVLPFDPNVDAIAA